MPKHNWTTVSLTTATLVLMLACFPNAEFAWGDESASAGTAKDERTEFFQTKVLPLLQSRCFECHGPGVERKGGLQLFTHRALITGGDSGPAVVPNHPEQSLLISAIKYESFEMPPRSRMPDAEIAIFERWIAEGAVFPAGLEAAETAKSHSEPFPLAERKAAHWAWHPIQSPPIPLPRDTSWPTTDVDHFVLQKLEQSGLTPPVDADRRAIVRRLYFDLIGLPPTLEEQDRFLNDPAEIATAIASVADELLQSPHFGERWGRHWLDLVRYAETLGHEFDYPLPHAWQYRDYVIRAINADVPYDQFVREHIAGDLLSAPRINPERKFNESEIATGFWFLCEDKHAPVDVKGEESSRVDNQIDVFSKAFLGLTVACARCHDHKFDAITTADYYALSGYLQSSRRRVDWLDLDGKTESWITQLEQQRSALRDFLTKPESGLSADVLAEQFLNALTNPNVSAAAGDPAAAVRPWAAIVDRLKQESSSRLDHPLSLLAELFRMPVEQQSSAEHVAGVVRAWQQKVLKSTASETTSSDLQFADFRGTTDDQRLPPGWLGYGSAFRRPSSSDSKPPAGSLRFDWTSNGPFPALRDRASSAELSTNLKGTLQSPTFRLQHPEILIQAAGKGCRVRLVIDGFVMNEFSELLFRGAKQPIDTDGEFRWIRLDNDTHRYIGHMCHLEFLDEGDGWFAVRQIRFIEKAGDPPPQDELPSALNLRLAEELRAQIDSAGRATESSIGSHKPLAAVVRLFSETLVADSHSSALAAQLRLFSAEANTQLERLSAGWAELAAKTPEDAPVLVMCDGSSEDEHIFIRGNHRNLGPLVPRRFLEALPELASVPEARSPGDAPIKTGSGRLSLAESVLADDNPLTARVAVNRVWQHLFGVGLVPSSDNFGVLGELPSHPELLDHLAAEFRDDGWSLKRLVRRLVTSRTYRISSQRSDAGDQIDPNNRLLHHARIRRLEGEVIRDAMLSVSGRLDPQMYGPSVPVYLTPFMEGRGRPKSSGPVDGNGRRSIYQAVNRNFLSPFMLAFDTPTPATAVGRRSSSNVPAQALILLNSEFVSDQAARWAGRLAEAKHPTPESLLTAAFRQACCRPPNEIEMAALIQFMESLAAEQQVAAEAIPQNIAIITEICHVLLNRKEFLFLD